MEEKKITSTEVRQHLAAHLARMWRYAMVLSRNRDVAEELVQSTCVRALERAHHYTPGTRIDRWLFTVLHSVWINELRAQRVRVGQGFVDSDELVAPDLQTLSDERLQYAKVMQRVGQLPEAQRNAVFLVYVEGFTYQEAAATLAVPIGTIMSRLAAARSTLAGAITARPDIREKRL
ncbi:sigma-70 family RNA polymerase sigma factor [Pantoea sp. NPDC088449]|uniref:sigma-70 family RNA polymerase sigma factor n=1 Tax=Pantoea sp. NPDC088449 TaxID=3364392 RepID=UPI0038111FD3